MTGFASLTRDEPLAAVSVTVRAVNHRHLDVQLRVPQLLNDSEPRLRALVQRQIARGRVELMVSLQVRGQPTFDVQLNEPFVAALSVALERAREQGLVHGDLAPGDLLRFPQAVSIRERPPEDTTDREAMVMLVEAVVEEALADLETMRVREGGYLRADLDKRRATLAELFDQIIAAADEGRAALEARLAKRIKDLAVDVAIEPALVAQEIVRLAGRSDISEEVSRFRGHLDHWQTLAHMPEPCGRKLDFLLQEMNREVNTVGSKAEGGKVAELVVAVKAELEKLREQVQNVE